MFIKSKMQLNDIKRLKKWCRDIDAIVPIAAYYLKLYTVEIILSMPGKDSMLRELAGNLLDEIEKFRYGISEEGVQKLINDQELAKIFMMNFSMSFYNDILSQIKNGIMNNEISMNLRCSIDIFQCLIHLWGNTNMNDTEKDQVLRKIKYTKYYLSKLLKGELGSKIIEVTKEPLEEGNNLISNDVYDLVTEVKKGVSGDSYSIRSNEEKGERRQDLMTPQNVDITPVMPVQLLNKDVKCQKINKFTEEEVYSMMDKSTQITQAQKLAKYAISALNYEDTDTAIEELKKALEILQELKK